MARLSLLRLMQIAADGYMYFARRKVRVLCFHRVNKYGDWFGIDTGVFEKLIKYLKTNYNCISLKDFHSIMNNEISVRKGLLITFDDGYRDFYSDAYPILRKYAVPAVMFLTTDFIDGKIWMWHDIYRFVVNNTGLKSAKIDLNGNRFYFDFGSVESRLGARRIIDWHCNKMVRKERLKFLDKVADLLGVEVPRIPTEEYAPCSWKEVRELANAGVDFGAHTCSHERLSLLDSCSKYEEIVSCKKRIEDMVENEVTAFAYPNGLKEDFTEEAKELLNESGFCCAFTTIRGLNGTDTDRFEIKRLSPSGSLGAYFIGEVSGLNLLKDGIKNRLLGL